MSSKHPAASHTPTTTYYHIALSTTSPPTSYTLAVSSPPTDTPADYHPNSLAAISHLCGLITSQSSIPLPTIHKLDTSRTLVPYPYALLSPPPPDSITLADARASNLLTPAQTTRIDLQLGLYLRQLHSIQNDWFGLPRPDGNPPSAPSYSWQESFTLFIEGVLSELEARSKNGSSGLDIPFADIRRYLSRAIGFYLFDDVEAPSLVGFTYSDEDVYVARPTSASRDPHITALVLPTRALWGDPMLETLFMPPGPSEALVAAYKGAGGGPLMAFPRQRTKRLWYTLFLAGVILIDGSGRDASTGKDLEEWAEEVIWDCVEKLKDAPCY